MTRRPLLLALTLLMATPGWPVAAEMPASQPLAFANPPADDLLDSIFGGVKIELPAPEASAPPGPSPANRNNPGMDDATALREYQEYLKEATEYLKKEDFERAYHSINAIWNDYRWAAISEPQKMAAIELRAHLLKSGQCPYTSWSSWAYDWRMPTDKEKSVIDIIEKEVNKIGDNTDGVKQCEKISKMLVKDVFKSSETLKQFANLYVPAVIYGNSVKDCAEVGKRIGIVYEGEKKNPDDVSNPGQTVADIAGAKRNFEYIKRFGISYDFIRFKANPDDPLDEATISLPEAIAYLDGVATKNAKVAAAQKQAEAEAERKLKSQLKGDKAKLYPSLGYPEDFEGKGPEGVVASPYWVYYDRSNPNWMHSFTYNFDKNQKLVNKEEHHRYVGYLNNH